MSKKLDFFEQFKRTSQFYQNEDGSFQPKDAIIMVKSQCKEKQKEMKLVEKKINLADYIGQGMVRDKIRNLGNQVIELEIDIQVRAANDEDPMDFSEQQY